MKLISCELTSLVFYGALALPNFISSLVMKKSIIFLLLTLLFPAFTVHAQALLSAEEGYGISLSKDQDGGSSLDADRDQKIYLMGPFVNNTGKTQAIRMGIELKEISSGECFYKVLEEMQEWSDGLQLTYVSFRPDFVVRNGSYEVRAVCMDYNKDASVVNNWEYVPVQTGFTYPRLNISGKEPVAYFSSAPYVGNVNNRAEIGDTKLHLSLTTLSAVESGELFVFVYEPNSELSIGYYLLSFAQNAGQTKDFTAEYQKSGSQAADLVVGKTYLLSFRFFENRKEQLFDRRYDNMKFSVVEKGTAIDAVFFENQGENCSATSGRKVMRQDGTLLIEQGERCFTVGGTEL